MIIIEDNRVFLTVLEPVSVLATSRKKVKRKLSAFFYDLVGASALHQSPRLVVGRLGRGKKKARGERWEGTKEEESLIPSSHHSPRATDGKT